MDRKSKNRATTRWLRTGIALLALLLFPAASCLDDYPYHAPQGSTSAGPRGSAAFLSGEASRTGLSPVKEGGRDAGLTDSGGGTATTDTGGQTDSTTASADTIEFFLDLLQ